MVSHLMQLNALAIVDIHVLLLCNSVHMLILQEAHISHELLGLELTHQVFVLPVKHCNMSLLRSNEQVLTISSEVKGSVGGEVLEVKVKDGVGVLHTEHVLEVFLGDLECTFSVVLFVHLNISMVLSVEVLVLFLKSSVAFVLELLVFLLVGFSFFIVSGLNGAEMVVLWFH